MNPSNDIAIIGFYQAKVSKTPLQNPHGTGSQKVEIHCTGGFWSGRRGPQRNPGCSPSVSITERDEYIQSEMFLRLGDFTIHNEDCGARPNH